MTRKLTLSVDDSIITRAKRYAEKHNESLSKLVENYFKVLINEDREEKEVSGLVGELLGTLTLPDDFDFKKEKREYLEQRYLHG